MNNQDCKNCGAWSGLHHSQTMQCPVGGREEVREGHTQEYMTTFFEVAKTVNNDIYAFPFAYDSFMSGGFTKREMFAMSAMQGLLANARISVPIDEIAQEAVSQADALLNALIEKDLVGEKENDGK